MRSGARVRRERRDDASLRAIRASRALNASWMPPRGARFVIPGHEDEPYEIWAMRRDARGPYVVLKSVVRPNAFLIRRPESEAYGVEYGYWTY